MERLFLVVVFRESKKDFFGNEDKEIDNLHLVLAEDENQARDKLDCKQEDGFHKYCFIPLSRSSFCKKEVEGVWDLETDRHRKNLLFGLLPYLIKEKLFEFNNKAEKEFPIG